jgi:hypothetical protein
VSGEPLRLTATATAPIAAFVQAIASLPDTMPDWVLVGGLATMFRAQQEHRVTVDIDTLVRHASIALEVLSAHGNRRSSHRFTIPVDVAFDLIEVPDTPEPDTVPPSDYAFALARRYAFDTAPTEQIEIDIGKAEPCRASCRVATVPALLALKTVSLPRRRDSNHPEKAMSDLLDLAVLSQAVGFDKIVASLELMPAALRDWILTTCHTWFVQDLRYTEARLRRVQTDPPLLRYLSDLGALRPPLGTPGDR